jgi:hypothetical protein
MGIEQFLDLLQYDADINIFFRGEYVLHEVLQQWPGCKAKSFERAFSQGN